MSRGHDTSNESFIPAEGTDRSYDAQLALEQIPFDRVRHGFESAVRAQLSVDVVQVVAQRVRGDAERARNRGGCASLSEELQDAFLLRRQRRDRCGARAVRAERANTVGCHEHSLDQMLAHSADVNVLRDEDDQPRV